MLYQRMPIEKESPEEIGYGSIDYNLAESSVTDLRFHELNLSLDDLKFEEEWRVNVQAIEGAIQSNTKLISITSPHNPTGMLMSERELNSLIALAEKKNIHLLVDETYRDTCFKTPYPMVAGQSKKV